MASSAAGRPYSTRGRPRLPSERRRDNLSWTGSEPPADGAADTDAAGAPLVQDCDTGPAGTRDVGACTGGRQGCQLGVFGACLDVVLPHEEVCNGVDDDCNGTVDDVAGFACQCLPGQRQACYDGPANTAGVGVCVPRRCGTTSVLPARTRCAATSSTPPATWTCAS